MDPSTYARLYLIRFEPFARSVAVSSGTTLLEAARRAGIVLPAACSGQGDCCGCELEILEGQVTPPMDLEENCILEGNLSGVRRLACCARILSNVQVRIPDDSGFRI